VDFVSIILAVAKPADKSAEEMYEQELINKLDYV
jgi:hypothetical protein